MTDHSAQALANALRSANFGNFPGSILVEILASRPWASASFSGARHLLSLLLEGPGASDAATSFLGKLDDHQFALDGHVVADISCHEREHWDHSARLIVEALTVVAD